MWVVLEPHQAWQELGSRSHPAWYTFRPRLDKNMLEAVQALLLLEVHLIQRHPEPGLLSGFPGHP
jgi:hypothetical protein